MAHGPSALLPRVYDLAFEAISHGDGRVDAETLSRFVAAYQTVTPLKLGELWAIPIMLRLALIENLRRVGARVAAGAIDRNRADGWADQMLDVAERDPNSLILVIADMARSNPPMVSSFVAELARRLQGQSAALALPLTWIEQRLAESGLTIEQLVQSETQEQAGDQVSISNTIGSLRFLGSMDWRDFVETMSAVESTLREDPGGDYAGMDFATRDRYRHVVEEIAKRSDRSEFDVAREAIALASEGRANGSGDDDRTAHVGFYLIDKGRPRLERAAEVRLPFVAAVRRAGHRRPLLAYLGAIAVFTTALTAALMAKAYGEGVPYPLLATLGILLLLATSQLAVGMVNWLATLLVTPHPLPRMDYAKGIPPQSRTLVVVPTMIASAEGIESLVEALEVRYLANRHDNLHFGLLTDFQDAPSETLPGDDDLLRLAREGIERLNEAYRRAPDPDDAGAAGDPFFLFHRPRRWNPQERTWMGHERKRGKLEDLNALLRNRANERFSLVVGDTAPLAGVKYVITLDTDTELPRDSARQFAGVMAHPLNRPRFAASGRRGAGERVSEGYGILQPRVCISLAGANRSWYARLHSGDAGIDPYTRAVSDVYQDVFREGSFIGKGIYDVDAVERALGGRFPENRILSHDLLEGCYARSGLLSDVQLYEEHPSTYRADVARRHRWVRGDWQLAGWLLPLVPGPDGRRPGNPLSALSLWKLVDNLRRSLVPAALTLLLLLGWTALPAAWLWTLAVVAILMLPMASAFVLDLLRKPDEVLLRQHVAATASTAVRNTAQTALTLAFLPYEASVNLDAIARTAWRMLVTHRRLLEWNPSAADERDPRRSGDSPRPSELAASVRSMAIAPAIAIATAFATASFAPVALVPAIPILLLWLVSPGIAWWISRPLARHEVRLTTDQLFFLRKLARRTWAFFETFVGPDDHWLPPDNWQEHPVATVAHRTSPTNMGFALLANLTAHDFGYLPGGQLLLRTAGALDTMAAMDRHQGHFYNWYDTQSLKPLSPLYVSSVDSGNLAGHLMTLRPGLLALADDRIVDPQWFEGLSDTLRTLVDAWIGTAPAPLARLQQDLEIACQSPPATVADARQTLDRVAEGIAEVATHVAGSPVAEASGAARPAGDPAFWTDALVRQCRALQDELSHLAPWSALPAAPSGSGDPMDVRGNPDAARARGTRRRVARLHRTQALRIGLDGGPRLAGRMGPGRLDGEPARRRSDGGDRAPGAAVRRAGKHGVRLPLRRRAPPARHRLQRRREPARPELLRSARVRSEVLELRGDRAGTPAAGELVRARAPAHDRRGQAGAPVLERLDVRVPDAAPGDAHLRQHAARPDLPRVRGPPDRLRQAARRALGHLRIRLQLGRCEPQLPIPCVRRARSRAETRTRRGSRRRALRIGARAHGGARAGLHEPAASRRRRTRRTIRSLRGHRLHRGAPASRASRRDRAFVHGAPPGHDPAVALAPAARPSAAEALRIGSAVQGDPAAVAGAHSEERVGLLAPCRAVGDPRDVQRVPRRRSASSAAPTRRSRKFSSCRTAGTTSWSRMRAAGAPDGRISPSPAGARTPPATTGARSATSATWRAANSGRPRISRR